MTLFAIIVAVYVWTDKKCQETTARVKEVEDCVEGKLAGLTKELSDLRISLARDLTLIKVKLGIPPDKG